MCLYLVGEATKRVYARVERMQKARGKWTRAFINALSDQTWSAIRILILFRVCEPIFRRGNRFAGASNLEWTDM